MSVVFSNQRVVSGMRASGRLHLGHYHGVIKNWLALQHQYDCYFFVADWHGLTTHYNSPQTIQTALWDMVIDWLACGINPKTATLFIQSWVPEHAQLHLLLSMITPLGWLERVPTFKDQQEKLTDKELSTYGFLGYPLLQSADVLIYKAHLVPVGEDQVPHIELTREIARRFNYLYGKESNFDQLIEQALQKMGKKNKAFYQQLKQKFQQEGSEEALDTAQALLAHQSNLSIRDKERLAGFLEGKGKTILVPPEALLTATSKMPGTDGQKMSKSYHNVISLDSHADEVSKKILAMPTDPARVKRSDKGNPNHCPLWQMHLVYSDETTKGWAKEGCTSASIGCVGCKKPIVDAIIEELKPIQANRKAYQNDLSFVKNIMAEGSDYAREQASKTLREVQEAMGIEEY